jgi:WD40 repeat protein
MERDWQMCTLTGHSSYVTRVQFSDDGAEVISASNDGTVRLSLDVWL